MTTGTSRYRIALRILALFLSYDVIDDSWEERDLVPDGAQFRPYSAVDFKAEEDVQVALLKIHLNGLWQVSDNFLGNTAHFTLKSNLLILAVKLLV